MSVPKERAEVYPFREAALRLVGRYIDGAVYTLLVAGLVRRETSGRPVDHKSLDRRAFGKASFRAEHITVTAAQRLAVRKLIQKAGIKVSSDSGNEGDLVPQFLNALQTMADKAGGEPPLPQRPDTRLLDELRVKAGNEQLLALYEYRGQLSSAIDEWKATAEAIQQRLPLWNTLRRLTAHARDLSDAQPLLERVDLIETASTSW